MADHPCTAAVVAVGWVPVGAERRAVAFACTTHRGLLHDAVGYGTDPRHRAELARRRARDAWLGVPQQR